MKPWRHDGSDISQASANIVKVVNGRQTVGEKRRSVWIRVRGVDCMLADIQAQLEKLLEERAYLRLMRESLVEMGLEDKGAPVRTTSSPHWQNR